MSEQGNARLNDVPVFAFGNAVMLRRVWAGEAMLNAGACKETREETIFTAAIGLHSANFGLQ